MKIGPPLPLARGHQNAVAAQRQRRLDVGQPVADPPRPREVDVERFLRLEKQLRARLAALARPGEGGMVRAKPRAVDVSAVAFEQLDHPALHGRVVLHRVEPARDSRLIADGDDEEAVLVEPANCVGDAGKQLHFAGLVQVSGILDDRAVAVEKDRLITHRTAAMTVSTWPGRIVRASSSTRLPATRAMIGGSWRRSRSASDSSGKPASQVRSFAPGNDPPPTSESPSISWPPRRSARARILFSFSVSIRSTGISRT